MDLVKFNIYLGQVSGVWFRERMFVEKRVVDNI